MLEDGSDNTSQPLGNGAQGHLMQCSPSIFSFWGLATARMHSILPSFSERRNVFIALSLSPTPSGGLLRKRHW